MIDTPRMTHPTVPSSGSEQPSELWPCEARLRNLTYSSSIHVRMTHITETFDCEEAEPEKTTRITNYCLCKVRVVILLNPTESIRIIHLLDSCNDPFETLYSQ